MVQLTRYLLSRSGILPCTILRCSPFTSECASHMARRGGSARGMFIWLVRIGKKYIHGGFESNRPIVTVIESMWGPVLWGLFKSVSGSGEDREWVESWMWAPGAVNQNRYCRLLRRGIIKKVLSNFTNAGSLFYALATCRWILSLDSYKQLRSNGQELYCTQTHSSGGRKGVKTREARRRGGGESEIMRDNESVGGVVPENTKWAWGRGRETAGESREKTVEEEECIIVYYIIEDEVWHQQRPTESGIFLLSRSWSYVVLMQIKWHWRSNTMRDSHSL